MNAQSDNELTDDEGRAYEYEEMCDGREQSQTERMEYLEYR